MPPTIATSGSGFAPQIPDVRHVLDADGAWHAPLVHVWQALQSASVAQRAVRHWLFTVFAELGSTKHVCPDWQSAAVVQ